MSIHRAITYGSVEGFRPLVCDVYVPADPRAVCIYLHGGGWRRGTRHDGPGHMSGPGEEMLERMAAGGLAIVACDYRLSGEARFPAQLDDVLMACEFVTSGLVGYGIPDVPLTLFGQSAGAHLAALAALDPRLDGQISAASCWSTPSDLTRHQDDLEAMGAQGDRGPTSREAQLLGGVVDEQPDRAIAASPVHQVRATQVDFQLVHGTNDVHVPIAQSERFAVALEDAGNPVTLVRVDGGDHFLKEIDRSRLIGLVDASVDFLLDAASSAGP